MIGKGSLATAMADRVSLPRRTVRSREGEIGHGQVQGLILDPDQYLLCVMQLSGRRRAQSQAGQTVVFAGRGVGFRLPLAARPADRLPIRRQVRENPAGVPRPSVPKEQPPR